RRSRSGTGTQRPSRSHTSISTACGRSRRTSGATSSPTSMARLPSSSGPSMQATGCQLPMSACSSSTSTTASDGSRSAVRTIFAFDTATSIASCSLVRDDEPIDEVRTQARLVLVAADELLRTAGIEPRELDGIVVGIGPGSFTGIRIGLATARGLALGLDLPVAGVSTLRAFAGGRPVIDARRGQVFVARPEELEVAGSRLVGDGALRYRELFEAHGAEVPPGSDPAHLPAAHLLVAFAEEFGPADAVEPLYLRAPDAKAPAA